MFFKKRRSRPTADEAARRLLVLKHVVAYAVSTPPREMLESMAGNWTDEEQRDFSRTATSFRDNYWGQVHDLGLRQELSPKEREFARSTASTMTRQQQIDATWRVESAQTLMWALGLLPEMPPYDTNANPEVLKESPLETAHGFIKSAQLRPETQIDRARGLAELWHWRSRTRQLIEKGAALEANEKMKAAGFHSFDDIVRFTAQKAFEKGNIQACIGMDFPVKGRAYRDLSPEEWSEVTSITAERHFALNWLCGHAPGNRWDETPTDT